MKTWVDIIFSKGCTFEHGEEPCVMIFKEKLINKIQPCQSSFP